MSSDEKDPSTVTERKLKVEYGGAVHLITPNPISIDRAALAAHLGFIPSSLFLGPKDSDGDLISMSNNELQQELNKLPPGGVLRVQATGIPPGNPGSPSRSNPSKPGSHSSPGKAFWGPIYAELQASEYAQYVGKNLEESMQSYLDALPQRPKFSLQYITPEELLCNSNLASLVASKSERIVPVLVESNLRRVDFRFLKNDLISQKDEITLVTELRAHLKKEPSGVSVLVGPSGSVKTRSMFDIARQCYCLFFECPPPKSSGGSADLSALIKLLRFVPSNELSNKSYENLEHVKKLVRALVFSRAYYMRYLQKKHEITPEDWLLLQLPTSASRYSFESIFSFCVWLTSEVDTCFSDMRKWLQLHYVDLVIGIDEANYLFETLVGHFKTETETRTEYVSFERPFLYDLLEEFPGHLMLAGTQLRLKMLEEVLGSVIGKFGSVERVRPKWRIFTDIQYIETPDLAGKIISQFVTLPEDLATCIFPDIVGRGRFTFGFLAALFDVIMSDNAMQTDESVSNVVHSVYFTYRKEVIEADTNSLLNTIINLHRSNYAIVFLEKEEEQGACEMISIPKLLIELAFASLFRSEFFFKESNKAMDLISLGVCLLKKSPNASLWSVGEPWAFTALLKFYSNMNMDLEQSIIHNQMKDILRTNGATDPAKGKMLEWLVALRLKSLHGKSLASVPLFKQALDDPACPTWFKNCEPLQFSAIVPDIHGKTVVALVQERTNSLLCFPAKEVRPDIFGVLPTTLLIGACKFLSSYDVSTWISNCQSSDPDNFYHKANGEEYPMDHAWNKLGKEFAREFEANLRKGFTDGVICLLVNLPKFKDGTLSYQFTNTAPTENQRQTRSQASRKRNDVIFQVALGNLDLFFAPADISIINLFYDE